MRTIPSTKCSFDELELGCSRRDEALQWRGYELDLQVKTMDCSEHRKENTVYRGPFPNRSSSAPGSFRTRVGYLGLRQPTGRMSQCLPDTGYWTYDATYFLLGAGYCFRVGYSRCWLARVVQSGTAITRRRRGFRSKTIEQVTPHQDRRLSLVHPIHLLRRSTQPQLSWIPATDR